MTIYSPPEPLRCKPVYHIKAPKSQKEMTMDMLNSNPAETVQVPASVPAPETTATPAVTATPAATTAPVAAVPAAAPVAPAIKLPLPQTDGHTVGGWNRFAGYNPNAAKNKPKDGRGGPGGRRA